MKLQQIHCFPIHSKTGPTLVPDIPYSYIASRPQTQEFLLLKQENSKSIQMITHGLNTSTYVGRLNTPILRAATTKECAIKLLFNPLNENNSCPLRAQIPSQDTMIKLSKPNTWLFSFVSPVVVHLSCDEHIITSQLTEQGILTINLPCQIQIGTQTLYYEKNSNYPLRIIQPPHFPAINSTMQELYFKHANEHTSPTPNRETQPILLTGDNTNQLIQKGTSSLDEIYVKLTKITEKTTPHPTHVMATTSMSITTVLLLLLAIVGIAKYLIPSLTKKKLRRLQVGASQSNSPITPPPNIPTPSYRCLEQQTPPTNTEKEKVTPTGQLKRGPSFARTKSVQIV